MEYIEKKSKDDMALLNFDLALHFYYCLIEVYNKNGIKTIQTLQE